MSRVFYHDCKKFKKKQNKMKKGMGALKYKIYSICQLTASESNFTADDHSGLVFVPMIGSWGSDTGRPPAENWA